MGGFESKTVCWPMGSSYACTKGIHVGDATHTTDNSGRVTRPGIRLYNVHVIVENVVGTAIFAVTLFKPSPDRSTAHTVFVKGCGTQQVTWIVAS